VQLRTGLTRSPSCEASDPTYNRMAEPFFSIKRHEAAVRIHCSAVLVSVCVLSPVSKRGRNAAIRRREPNRRRMIRRFGDLTRTLNDLEFSRAFRMSHGIFERMILSLGPLLQRDALEGIRSSGGFVEPYIRVSVTIRMLDGASYLDFLLAFCIAKSTVYCLMHETIEEINERWKLLGLPFGDDRALLLRCRTPRGGFLRT
jgi:hypothetical protein